MGIIHNWYGIVQNMWAVEEPSIKMEEKYGCVSNYLQIIMLDKWFVNNRGIIVL